MQEVERKEDVRRVLELALEAGRVLLRHGAEIFRVEETIERICKHYDIDEVDSFVLSNGIFLTAYHNGEESFAKVKHVPMGSIHLGIVTEVNALSREIAAGKVTVEEAFERLHEIEQMPPRKHWKMIVSAGLGSGFFGYLLNGSVTASVMVFFVAMLLYVFVLFAQKHNLSKILVHIMGGMLITVLSLLCIQLPTVEQVKVGQVIIGAILPLVPGVAFTNAIRDIADSDFISGTVRMIDAIFVFVYIAIGVGCVLTFYQTILGGIVL